MNKKAVSWVLAAAAVSCMAMGMTGTVFADEAETVTVTDMKGREVTVELPIEKAYLGFYYESFLTAVGEDAFTKVAATSLYDTEGYFYTLSKMYREYVDGYADMVDVGSTMQDDFDLEKMIETGCDVALIAPYQYSYFEDKLDMLEEAGIPVVVIDYGTATEETHMQSTEILGQLFQVEDRTDAIREEYTGKMQMVRDRVAEAEEAAGAKKTVFHEFHSTINSYSEIGVSDVPTFLVGSYLAEGGADDIVNGAMDNADGVNVTLDKEYIMEQDPDAWFIVGGESTDSAKDGCVMGNGITEDETKASLDGMLDARAGWETLNMVKNNQIYCIENGLLRTLRDYIVIEYIAKCLYPDSFEDVDPAADLAAFSEEYLPMLPTDGTYFYHYDLAE